MNLLLDTHALIWVLEDNPTLSEQARNAIINGKNVVFVSAATVWEMSIKQSMGKLEVPDNVKEEMELLRFTPLEITFEHAKLAGQLPNIHKDTFDRMLIAQAKLEGLMLVSGDRIIKQYDVKLLKA